MIGKHYDRDNYNCAHFVADWYSEKLGIIIPVINEFDISFVKWMRSNFTEINSPHENCLVLMQNHRACHIGVYSDNGVYHNYQASTKTKGAVVHSQLGFIKRSYNKVTYWKWLQSFT